MKKILYTLILSAFVASCTDLDVENLAALPQEIVLQDVDGFESVLFAAYESVNDFGYYGQTMMIAPEILADNMDLVNLSGRYEQEFVNAENAVISIWFNRYTAINECNIVINLINDENVAGEQEAKDQLIAEAKFLRALFYHDLVKVYGYEPGQEVNSFDLGVVLRTEATVSLSDADDRPRATNEEIYQQIEQDLLEAIDDLPDAAAGSTDVARANKAAARLLLARVYLYWGKNTEAANYAQQVIAGDGSDLVQAADYFDSWDDAAFPFHPESVFESDLRIQDWSSVDGANNSLHSLTSTDTDGNFFVVTASAELVAEIDSDPEDIRRDMLENMSLGEMFTKWRGAKGTLPFQENIPILRLSEGYLIAAEALGAGAGDAILNAFRAARGMTTQVPANIDNVLRERRIEYMAEGHRFFDLKRLGRNITKPASAGVGTLPYNDFKVLSRIPQSELELSEGLLTQNPGYN